MRFLAAFVCIDDICKNISICFEMNAQHKKEECVMMRVVKALRPKNDDLGGKRR